ncbi:unnamed protein product, partial [marine sediment metagenome]
LDIIGLLRQKGAEVDYHDPFIPEIAHDDWILESVPDVIEGASAADCVVIVTNHTIYDYPRILAEAQLIIDTRNALRDGGRSDSKVVKL